MRIYDGKYLSVTSVLRLKEPFDSKSFKEWCKRTGNSAFLISNTSRILGSKVSEYLDNRYRSLEWLTGPPTDDLEARLYSSVEDFLKKWDLVSTEEVVKCEEFNYAGRYDGIIENKKTGEKVLCDWKTFGAWKDKPYKRDSNKIKKTRWQLTMYAYAMGWKDDLGVVVFKNDGEWELEKVKFDKSIMKWVVDNQDLILKTIENEKQTGKRDM